MWSLLSELRKGRRQMGWPRLGKAAWRRECGPSFGTDEVAVVPRAGPEEGNGFLEAGEEGMGGRWRLLAGLVAGQV